MSWCPRRRPSAPISARFAAAVSAGDKVKGLLVKERYRMWTVVMAGTDLEGDVAALTRGGQAFADVDRLMSATEANVVKELKAQPDQIGILGTVLDARIFHLDMFRVLAVARNYGFRRAPRGDEEERHADHSDATARGRLMASELGVVLAGDQLGTRRRGQKPGDNTKDAFPKLTETARQNDGLLNDAIARGLTDCGADLGRGDREVVGYRARLQERHLLHGVRSTASPRDDVEVEDQPRRSPTTCSASSKTTVAQSVCSGRGPPRRRWAPPRRLD
jgi:hypothetical protein